MRFLGLAVLAWLLSVFPGRASEIRLTGPLHSEATAAAEAVLREAYRRLGYTLKVEHVPSRRALGLSSTGQMDGEVIRMASITKTYPTLIPSTVPILHIEVSPWVANSAIKIASWQDLTPYRVGIVKGIQAMEAKTAKLERYLGKDVPELLDLLSKERVDVVMASDRLINYMRSSKFPELSQRVRTAGEPLMRQPVFHFLHKSKATLMVQVDRELKAMEESGDLARLRDQAYQQFFDSVYKNYQLTRCAEVAGC